jgi:Na+/melibiose symporter-like transporter
MLYGWIFAIVFIIVVGVGIVLLVGGCNDESAGKFWTGIATTLVGFLCFLTWLITFHCCRTENVKAQETQQEFDITVQNPQNKDINLNVNNE